MQTLPLTGPITRVAQQIQNPLNGDSIKPPAHRNPLTTAMQDQAMLGFAEGGEVKETTEQLMARMAAKYGTSGAAQSAPVAVQSQAPQPQPTPAPQKVGVVGLLKWRGKQIDEAANYANGGKIEGPGTARSDSILAEVQPTGEPIRVSTDERILSKDQDALMERLAQKLGFDSLDALLKSGTGKAVGPTIRAGTRAAANGLLPENDPQAIASGGQINPLPGVVRAGNSFSQDLSAAQPSTTSTAQTRALPETANVSALQATPIGDGEAAAGSITRAVPTSVQPQENVNPAQASRVGNSFTEKNTVMDSRNPLTTIDMAGNIASMARANAIRQSAIDAQPSGSVISIGNSGLAETNALMDKWGREDQAAATAKDIINNPRSANALAAALGAQQHADASRYGNDVSSATSRAVSGEGNETARRGQDITAQTQSAKLAGNPLDNLLKQTQVDAGKIGIDKTKQHIADVAKLNAETDPGKRQVLIENLLTSQGKNAATAERLTLPMQRSNAEIDAARKLVAGLSQEEIRRRTAKQTNTGRDNPDFDPTLERAMSLANRRKVGADDYFDLQQEQAPQAQPPQGTGGDAITNFRADPAMKNNTPGKQTANGTEVFDSTGKLIGYYR